MSDSEQLDNDSSIENAETEPKKSGRTRGQKSRASKGDKEQSSVQEDVPEVEKTGGRRRLSRRSKGSLDADGASLEAESKEDEQESPEKSSENIDPAVDSSEKIPSDEPENSHKSIVKQLDVDDGSNEPRKDEDTTSQPENTDTDKSKSQESTEKKIDTQIKEDTEAESSKEGREVKESDENGKDVVKIEESESDKEDEEEVVVLEDIEDDGEDPWEVEVEKYNQPPEQMVLGDLTEMHNRRKLVVYPLKMSELNNAVLLKVIDKTFEFRTCFIQTHPDDQPESVTWNGFIELIFRSTKTAADVIDELKTIRDGINVQYLEPGEVARKVLQTATGSDALDSDATPVNCTMIASAVTDDMTVEDLLAVFQGAADVVIPAKRFPGKQIAYIIYETANDMSKAFEKFTENPPEVRDKKLRVLKYDPAAAMPAGLLRMKRRYKLLLQSDKLKRALKDKNANHPRSLISLMRSTIDSCKAVLEKDDSVRKELGLPTYSLAELRRYKRIRESITDENIWIPGRKNRLAIERSLDNDESDDNKYRRYQNEKTNDAAIPSLMSVELTPQLIKVPNMSGRMGPSGPPPIGMRGGIGGGGPRGGGGFMRGGPPDMVRGGFRGGRGGGFHDGPPLPLPPRHDYDFDSFHGRREGFGRGFDGGFRGGRGGNFGRGSDDGFHGGRDGGGFGRGGFGRDEGFRQPERGGFRRDGDSRGGFSKRPRSPPPSGFKGDDASHSKMQRRDDEGKWSGAGNRQEYGSGPRGGRGGRGGFRQDGGNWNQSGGARQSEQNKPSFSSGGQSQQQPYGQNVGGSGSTTGPGVGGASSAGGSGSSYSQQPMAQVPPAAGYGQGYGQQPQPQSQQQTPPSQMSGYGQTMPPSAYGQQGYDSNAASMAAYGQQTAAYGQSGYGQAAGYGGQSQDPNAAYAGYGQATGTDYYQAYQAGMVQYPGYQTGATGQQQQAAQSWGMMSGTQQYWSGEQQQQAQPAASWPTGAEGTAVAATTDPNAAYWAAAGWKPT